MRVIYLPGMSGRGAFWHPIARRLPAEWDSVFLDWPGLGDVPPSPSVNGFPDLAAHVLEQLEEPSSLVAQSMGGVVATAVALIAPEKVLKLVLCATSGGIDMRGAADWRPGYQESWPNAPAWALQSPPDRSDELQRIVQPTLLLWASDDPISPVAVGRRLESLMPNARLSVVPSDNHMFARDTPDVVVPKIHAHLEADRARFRGGPSRPGWQE